MIRLYCAVRAAVKDGEQLGIASKASGVVITSVTWACGPTHRNEKPFIGCHPERRAQTGSPASTGFVLAVGARSRMTPILTLAWHDFRRSAARNLLWVSAAPTAGPIAARRTSRLGVYQGTTFSRAERSVGKVRALTPEKPASKGLKPKSLLTRCGTSEDAP